MRPLLFFSTAIQGNLMSRIFMWVFCFVVIFLVVYNTLQVFPSIAANPTAVFGLKIGAVIVTVCVAKLVFTSANSNSQT
jgi:hypothetical protein